MVSLEVTRVDLHALDPDAFLPKDYFRDRVVIVGLSLQNAPEINHGGADAFATPYTVHTGRLVAGVEPAAGLPDEIDPTRPRDWADLRQRMHYIVHLFRAFHASQDILGAPFTPDQVAQLETGVIPSGDL